MIAMEKLLLVSSLSSGTALEHFSSIDTTAGVAVADFADLELEAEADVFLEAEADAYLERDSEIELDSGSDLTIEDEENLGVSCG